MQIKLISVASIIALMSLMPVHAYAQSCINLYDALYDCSANSYMTNTPSCKRVLAEWPGSGCTAQVCNMPTLNGLPYVNCGVNQGRYDACMSSGMGKGRAYMSPEQFCTQWAGPA